MKLTMKNIIREIRNMSIKIKLKDGSIREIDDNSTVFDLAQSISRKLGKSAVVGEVNVKLV